MNFLFSRIFRIFRENFSFNYSLLSWSGKISIQELFSRLLEIFTRTLMTLNKNLYTNSSLVKNKFLPEFTYFRYSLKNYSLEDKNFQPKLTGHSGCLFISETYGFNRFIKCGYENVSQQCF